MSSAASQTPAGPLAGPVSSSQFGLILSAALSEYQKKTGNDLLDHWLAKELQSCESAEAVLGIIQQQAEAFDKFRDRDKGSMKWIGPSVHVLYTISATLGEGVSMALPSAKVVFAGIGLLLTAAKDVWSSHDALVELFQRVQFFLKRLGVHTHISPTKNMVEILVQIMAEVITILSIATKEMQQSRTKSYFKKLIGRTDIEDALKRLDSLTQEEIRMAIAQILKAMSELKDDTKKANDAVRQIANDVGEIKDDVGEIKWNQIEQDIRKWFSPPDPSVNYNIAREAYQEGTAAWFFEGSIFKEWDLVGSLLWIHGKPGSGKSILCSGIIKHVMSLRDAGHASLAYFFFDFRDKEKKQNVRGFLTSLLIQLSVYSEPCCNMIFRLYSTHGKGAQQPSIEVLINCLMEMLKVVAHQPVYIIVDALDECPDMSGMPTPRETVLNFVEDLAHMQLPSLHVCITSRPEVDIKEILEPLAYCVISLHDESGQQKDISDYVRNVVSSDRKMRKWRVGEKELVVEELSSKADGMFRWVFCQLEVLRHCLPASIRTTLDQLPKSLDETYARVLSQIPEANQAHAHRMLQCLVVAVRPLRVEELAEVLAFEFDIAPGSIPRYRVGWQSNNQEQAVLSTCSSLISIVDDYGSQVVQFSHFSVKEFLMSDRLLGDFSRYQILLGPAHTILAQACLGSLLHLDDRVDKHSIESFPLAEYAATHWLVHARFEDVASRVKDGLESLFDCDKPHFEAWISLSDRDYAHSSNKPTPLYYSSLYGFSDLVDHLAIKHPQHVNALGGWYNFPLCAALIKKRVRVAEILLKHGANVDIRGTGDRTPMHQAITWTSVHMVQFLLDHGANANAEDDHAKTPLHLVSYYYSQACVSIARLLLERGADANSGTNRWTPLHSAALKGRLEIARLLLDHGANARAENDEGETPLDLASRKKYDSQEGGVSIPQLLLERGADANSRTNKWTPLHSAAFNGMPGIARVLLDYGADPNAENDEGETPLDLVSRVKYKSQERGASIARLLLERGADANSCKNKWSPLYSAAFNGMLGIARALLDHGANPNAENGQGETPLDLASRKKYDSQEGGVSIPQLLLERGADANSRTNKWTPLHSAAFNGMLEIARVLLDHGANANAENDEGETPLVLVSRVEYDSQERGVSIARLLLERGADVNSGKNKWTPLHLAAFNGKLDVARVLLDGGANANAENDQGEMPLHLMSRGNPFLQGRYVGIVRLLMERGVDVDARVKKNQWTSLHLAAFHGWLDIALVLLDHGANVNIANDQGHTPLCQESQDQNTQCKHRNTALHLASYSGHLETAQLLLHRGANANAVNNQGETPLHIVSRGFYRYRKQCGVGIAWLLLKCGVDVDARMKNKWTSLHLAAFYGMIEITQALLDHGANANVENDQGQTPLHLVSRGKYRSHERCIGMARLLLKRGVDVHAQDKHHDTALHLAAFWGRPEVARVLLNHGANPTAENDQGETPLHLVSRGENKYGSGIPQLLLERGVDVNAPDKVHNTPLHSASYFGRLEIARALLDRGAKVDSENDRAQTPLHLVSDHCYWFQDDGLGVAKLLLERGADMNAQDKDYATPLHLACYRGRLDIARVLLDYDAKAHAENN